MNRSLQRQCDLHIHSIFSDSDSTPENIFKAAVQKELSCIAITDHDTISGIKDAIEYSKFYKIELVEAIELSAQHKGIEIHLLGYFINSQDTKLQSALANIRELREERLLAMVKKLNALGMKVDSEELKLKIRNTIATRLHLGLYLLEKRVVSSLLEAFRRYLSPGKPGYVARFKYSVKEAIELIKASGGLAFLAHPHIISDQSWIEEFITLGLDGLEVVYPRMHEIKRLVYTNMVAKFGLLRSGGSDAHGSYKEFTEVGGVTIPYEWVEEMKERIAQKA